MLLDSHTHVVSPEPDRFARTARGLGREWWTEPGRDVEALIRTLDDHRVERAVLVQAVGAHGYDNSYLLDAARRFAPRVVAVPAVDLDDPLLADGDIATVIGDLARDPVVTGIRLFAVSPASRWTARPARVRAAFDAAGAARLVMVLTLFESQLAALAGAVVDHEGPVALDHCAFPGLRAGLLPDDAPLLALERAAHVTLKVSSHLLLDAAAAGASGALVGQLVARFGPDRILWGSDYPQTGADYGALVALAERAAGGLSGADREAFFAANAARVFGRPGLS